MKLSDIINKDLVPPGTLTKWGYRTMTDAEYFAFPAVNASLLKCATLAEMYALLTAPQKQTEALAIGTLADMAILTPYVLWHERFAVVDVPVNSRTGEPYGRTSKKASDVYEAMEAANPGRFVVSLEEMKQHVAELTDLQTAFAENALCAASLTDALKQVVGIMWHPTFFCWVKWKPDVLPLKPDKAGHRICDLKTTRRHPLQFEMDCREFSYFDQAGWYAHCHEMLLSQQGLRVRVSNFDFLVVSKPDDGRRPRRAMARCIRVPLDPELNYHMQGFHSRLWPKDGMGKVEQFLTALGEHTAQNPATDDTAALRKIWTAYESESTPWLLCKMPRI